MTKEIKLPKEGTCVETTDEFGQVDRGIYRGIAPGKPTGSSRREREDKVIIDGGSFVAHISRSSLRKVKRIPGGMAQFARQR